MSAACFGLFHLWRAALPSQRWLQWVVAAGFLGRAVAGQLLFWISWIPLPIARRLQLGEGLWFFAIDGANYYRDALAAATHGFGAILALDRTAQSVMFTQTLASAIWLFGRASSVGLLLNLACFLGMIVILKRWASEPDARIAAAVAIVGISLSPSVLLWSLQPLKDTLFQFLFVAFVAACAAWERAWTTPGSQTMRWASGILMILLLPALAAIRWYFGFALLLAASLFLLLVAVRSVGRMAVFLASVAAAVLVILLSRGLVVGAGPYLPPSVGAVLTPITGSGAARKLPESLVDGVERARESFDRVGGQTAIRPGSEPEAASPSAKLVTWQPAARKAELTPIELAEIHALFDEEVAGWNRGDLKQYLGSYWQSEDLVLVKDGVVSHGWQAISANFRSAFKQRGNQMGRLAMSELEIEGGEGNASVRGRWELTFTPVAERKGVFRTLLRRFPDGWKTVRVEVAANQVPVAGRPDAPEFAAGAVQPERAPGTMSSRFRKLTSGIAVIVIPRSIGEWLGLFRIGGGRGMLWFTELDTVVFDIVLVYALWVFFRRLSASLRKPLVWLVLLTTLMVGLPLAYTVTNFGTLFRLREMIFAGLLLTPLAVVASTERMDSAKPGT